MKNMGKVTTVNLKVTPEFKALLVKRAADQDRSLTAYIEWLVMQDAAAARTKPKNRRG
jgi:predicted HicB family RNase H-like nuclease